MSKSSVFLSLVLFLWSQTGLTKWYSSFDETAINIKVEEHLAKLTTKQKIGQLFIFGIHGKNFNSKIQSLLHDTNPGGVILFSRNIHSARQLARLNQSLQRASLKNNGTPLLIALDQEGGTVSRIRTRPKIPSALALGQTKDETLSEQMGYFVGQLLKSLGVNMNLAPVLDLSDPYESTFIGTRSFGDNPLMVSQMANAYATGLESAGVIATGKHFPGHGGLTTDSHQSLPVKYKNFSQLMTSDLMPFSLFMKSVKAPAIMVAHVAYPKIDPSRMPATFSKQILTGVLRSQLKYDGLIITDDIEMNATKGFGSFEKRTVGALKAGADLIMVAWSQKAQRRAYQAVEKALKTKEISLQAIDDAARRVIKSKFKYTEFTKTPQIDLSRFRNVMQSSSFKDLNQLILEKNFYSSLNQLSEKSFVHTSAPVFVYSLFKSVASEFSTHSQLKSHWLPLKTPKASVEKSLKKHSNSYLIAYITGKSSAQRVDQFSESLKKRTFVINTNSPSLLTSKRENFLGVINIFSSDPSVAKLVAENIIRKL